MTELPRTRVQLEAVDPRLKSLIQREGDNAILGQVHTLLSYLRKERLEATVYAGIWEERGRIIMASACVDEGR